VNGGPRPIEVQARSASDVLQVRSTDTDLRLGHGPVHGGVFA
jgi:hypothetical protein